jgi:hypothetical protein
MGGQSIGSLINRNGDGLQNVFGRREWRASTNGNGCRMRLIMCYRPIRPHLKRWPDRPLARRDLHESALGGFSMPADTASVVTPTLRHGRRYCEIL